MSSSYLSSKKDKVYEKIGFKIYDDISLENIDIIDGDVDEPTSPDNNDDKSDNDKPANQGSSSVADPVDPKTNYIGTLEISKINLKKGFVDPSSKYNNISYNVTIIQGSQFPDVEKGNFILAAHSGTANISYFRNLYKLKIGDTAVVTYKNKKYTYKIVNIYYQTKQGYVGIRRDVNKSTLTLITCTKDNKKSQTVYIAELI